MRFPKWGVYLLGVGCCGVAGCSQLGGLRPNGAPDIKTVASVDDRPVATVAGEPGTGRSRREEVEGLDPPPAAGTRISGRVFDQDGRAVPNAKVRLGVGGSTGGRVNFATTDRSGAFTLHGLRPGRDYALIAEYQGDDGMMTGRTQARAPGSGVRIELAARDPDVGRRGPKVLPARVRSGLFPADPADDFPATARPRVREAEEADAEPPAEEAASYTPRPARPPAARLASAATSAPIRAGWNVRHQPPSVVADQGRDGGGADKPRDRPPSPAEIDGDEDDGENPLPPALEPVDSAPPRSSGRVGSTGAGSDRTRDLSSRPDARARRSAASTDRGYSAVDPDPDSHGPAPRPIPDEALPPGEEDAVSASGRAGGRPTRFAAAPSSQRAVPARRGPRPGTSPAGRPRSGDVDADEPGDRPQDATPQPRTSRRPTWRELSIRPDSVPVDEALRRSSADEDDPGTVMRSGGPDGRDAGDEPEDRPADEDVRPRRGGDVAEGSATAEAPPPRRTRPTTRPSPSARRPTPSTAPRPAGVACRLDQGRRRIVELQLPGLDGAMKSLRDVDADLVLLDFWGSWCRECRPSIEHHRELQARLGSRRIQVIGIACETGPTPEARRDAAAAAARELGIRYPVLVTTRDGTCPVQRALQVQFYPSMVLLDREGNILQFQQGANDTTLGRIDRAVAKALRDVEGDGRAED